MKMKILSREEQLERWRERYGKRGPAAKARMLDELCEEYGYHRKHAIRLLNGEPQPKESPPGPEPKYQAIAEVVEQIWAAGEQPCGKRLAQMLGLWLPYYQRRYGRLLPSQRRLVQEVSAATLDRLLASLRARGSPRGLSGTKPGRLLRQQIPIQGEVWDERRPGFLEADSVAHCGSSLAGSFIWSLTFTDLASTWTSDRAVWNKGAAGVLEQTRHVEEHLPFALLGLDFDNGSEWLNWHLIRYLQQRAQPVRVTRSRPYHSDDNAHVEQKNWMWPRQALGYGRLEDAQLVAPINALYEECWGPLHNFFLPSMKLVKKWRVGANWHRQHDRAQTAYQRLLALGVLAPQKHRQLTERFHSLDPFDLHDQIEQRLRPILAQALEVNGKNLIPPPSGGQ
jgi:hypothetical protein